MSTETTRVVVALPRFSNSGAGELQSQIHNLVSHVLGRELRVIVVVFKKVDLSSRSYKRVIVDLFIEIQ